jgi:transposase-like protein
MGCFVGIGLADSSDGDDLQLAYGEFATEARQSNPDYQPHSVNLDGWEGRRKAWKQLFPTIVIMRCFLHVVLGIQQYCRSQRDLLQDLTEDLWHLFQSENRTQWSQRLRRLREWVSATAEVPRAIQEKLDKLKENAAIFQQMFDYPEAYRTSNQVDRLHNYLDRLLYAMQYFHDSKPAAKQSLRAMALIWNFHPYGRKVQRQAPDARSPFEALNGFCYHEHWLKNLLIAASMNGRNTGEFVSHKSVEN